MQEWISSPEAAKRFGVSASTFKRFCDRNNIPVTRTPGGHWRIHECHLEVVSGLWKSKRTSLESSLDPQEIFSLLQKAEVNSLIERFLMSTSDVEQLAILLEDYLVPVLWQLGDRWARGESSTADEKVITATTNYLLDFLHTKISAVSATKTAIGCSFVPNIDTVGSKMVAIGLKALGMKTIDLGGHIDPRFLAEAALKYHADLVWISYTHTVNHDVFAQQQNVLRSLLPRECRVIIGGGGLVPSQRRLVPHTQFYESISDMMSKEKDFCSPPSDKISPESSIRRV